MQLIHLTLWTRDLAAQRAFYGDLLGWPVSAALPGRLDIQAGATTLTFRHDLAHTAFSHLAFDIPRALVQGAQTWLEARLDLLADAEGRTCFLPTAAWNTTNLYFDDPAGNILEFVARHDRTDDEPGPFGPDLVRHVSELGLVVPDVPAAVRGLARTHGLHPFNGQGGTFTPVGGHGGMLIVVPRGRGWFPVGRPAVPAPFALTFAAGTGTRTLTPADLPA